MKKVLIIGAGFGGLACAKRLARVRDLQVTLVDRRNHHLFQPLLYQVAMAGLSPAEIAAPIRSILKGKNNIEVILDEIKTIDLAKHEVASCDRSYSYDWLVVASGANHSYFGHDEWEENAPGLKTLEQATEIRRRVLLAFERAETAETAEERKRQLTFVIVGGGATGVELAGALAEMTRFSLSREFRKIDPKQTRIILIEAGTRILATFHPDLSQKAKLTLEEMGVVVWVDTRVTAIDSTGVFLGKERIETGTAIWAAGVQPSFLSKFFEGKLDRQGRILVEQDLSVNGHTGVFVIGDLAHFEQEGKSLPGVAPVAMQQGRWVAKNILLEHKGKKAEPFIYNDKGQVATIGRKKAVGEIRGLKLSGFLAWLIWLFVHVYYLIGFKNRFMVLLEWAFSYFGYRRGARLIVEKEWRTRANDECSKN